MFDTRTIFLTKLGFQIFIGDKGMQRALKSRQCHLVTLHNYANLLPCTVLSHVVAKLMNRKLKL